MVNLYSKPGCGQCIATKLQLDKNDIEYNYIDVTTDSKAFDYIANTLGYMQMPVVETDEDSWYGFRPDKIENLADSLAA